MTLDPVSIQPFEDNVPLRGEDAPSVKQIDDLIRYLVTVRHRWGNTCVTFAPQEPANALWKIDDYQRQIEALESQLASRSSDAAIAEVAREFMAAYDGPGKYANAIDKLRIAIAPAPQPSLSRLEEMIQSLKDAMIGDIPDGDLLQIIDFLKSLRPAGHEEKHDAQSGQ